ncbi:hypothetical protein [Frigidibacter sp. MR17.24]|uniref:hypothetical protein n=1 Tax=Frigidibacter sp. MR17.24 TaxID=3127345 RepID=UPI003013098C
MSNKIDQNQIRSDPASKRTFDPNERGDLNTKQPGRPGKLQRSVDERSERTDRDHDPADVQHMHVRDAGRGQMDDPPERWCREDEESDESFPASDPPGNY